MPAVRSFSELTDHFSPELRQRIEQRKEQLRQDKSLAEPRNSFSLTQEHAGQEPVPRQPPWPPANFIVAEHWWLR